MLLYLVRTLTPRSAFSASVFISLPCLARLTRRSLTVSVLSTRWLTSICSRRPPSYWSTAVT